MASPALAEILLDQGLLAEARGMLERLQQERPGDGRIGGLLRRLVERERAGEPEQRPAERRGRDAVTLVVAGSDLEIRWELTEAGLDLARRAARCSGSPVVRLSTVTSGPRGVRRSFRDIALAHSCGSTRLAGLPRPAVHVAAAGFLARSGVFVPLAASAPVEGAD